MRHGPAGSAGGGRQGARGACLQARAGGVRGARVRGAAAGRAVGGQEGDQAVGPARGHSPAQASRLRASRAHTPPARRCFVPPRTRAPPLAGPEPGRELVGEGAWGGLSFSTSHRGKLGLTPLPALLVGPAPPASTVSPPDPPGHTRTPRLPSLSPSLGLSPPPRLGSQPLIQPQLFPGRGSVGGGVSPNKPKASE